LYRTEFLYLGKETLPSEEEHYRAYCDVLATAGDRPVVIRTFDMGADKVPEFQLTEEERNPFLGLRSIRLALRFEPLLRTQLRAILRASVKGNVRIMFPLISTVMELRRAKMIVSDVMEDLLEEGIPFNRDVPIGMMVEVPAAAITLSNFVHDVDFFSIGTNDLVQYTLAVDRANTDVVSLYNSSDPAVLRLLKMVIDTASEHNIPVGMCGQMSSSSLYTMLLLGLGLRQFSVVFHALPEIKQVCRSVTIEQCRRVAERALTMENARNIKAFLRQELKSVLPDLPPSAAR
ncbi:MAG: phosphoenolpyruvate--protein phosphotransferase, partial [Planctomycetota bacterium]